MMYVYAVSSCLVTVQQQDVIKSFLCHRRSEIFNLLIAENVRSELAVVTGTVRNNLSNLCSSEHNDFAPGISFIA